MTDKEIMGMQPNEGSVDRQDCEPGHLHRFKKDDCKLSFLDIMLEQLSWLNPPPGCGDKVRLSKYGKDAVLTTEPSAENGEPHGSDKQIVGIVDGHYDENDRRSDGIRDTVELLELIGISGAMGPWIGYSLGKAAAEALSAPRGPQVDSRKDNQSHAESALQGDLPELDILDGIPQEGQTGIDVPSATDQDKNKTGTNDTGK